MAARRSAHLTARAAATEVSALGLIFDRGLPGSWDEGGVGAPVVRCYVGDNEERWVMWYSGRTADSLDVPTTESVDAVAPSAGSAGVAISGDGINWLRGADQVTGARDANARSDVGRVMSRNEDWWWFDTAHMQVSDVQILSSSNVDSGTGVFWMFYSGGDYHPMAPLPDFPGTSTASTDGDDGDAAPPAWEGFRTRPGLAMSQDGRNWARIEAEHHTGALFDVGEEGAWDELFIGSPQMLATGPKDMRMYYHSYDRSRGRFVVGMARSEDGFKWSKSGVVFDPREAGAKPGDHDELGAASICVTRDVDNRQYVMFYEAVAADSSRSIGMAVSKDGTKDWKRCPSPVLHASDAAAWDDGAIGSPCAVSMSKGKWRLYYAGRRTKGAAPHQGIGVALSVDDGDQFEGMPARFARRTGSAAAPQA